MRTFSPKPEHVEEAWHLVDADGLVLGRLATEVASILRGKHKAIFAPHADVGDHVVVVNAAKIVLTAGKEQRKVLYRHSGFPGGLKKTSYSDLLSTQPETLVYRAVRGMLPKTRLGRQQSRKLKVYAGADHPHDAQKPQPLQLPAAAARG